jgi:hypothetical protein
MIAHCTIFSGIFQQILVSGPKRADSFASSALEQPGPGEKLEMSLAR